MIFIQILGTQWFFWLCINFSFWINFIIYYDICSDFREIYLWLRMLFFSFTIELSRKQTEDMEKIAQMKYGDDTNEMVLYDFDKLGQAVAIFDLLKVKHGNPIPIGNVIRQSCSAKGAVFILYNVARVQRVLNTFYEKVASGYYSPLPELNQIDVSLLREEVCWTHLEIRFSFPFFCQSWNLFYYLSFAGGMAAALCVHTGFSTASATLHTPNWMRTCGHSFVMQFPYGIHFIVQRLLSSRQNIDSRFFLIISI